MTYKNTPLGIPTPLWRSADLRRLDPRSSRRSDLSESSATAESVARRTGRLEKSQVLKKKASPVYLLVRRKPIRQTMWPHLRKWQVPWSPAWRRGSLAGQRLRTAWPAVCRRFWWNWSRRCRPRRRCARSRPGLVRTACSRCCLDNGRLFSLFPDWLFACQLFSRSDESGGEGVRSRHLRLGS